MRFTFQLIRFKGVGFLVLSPIVAVPSAFLVYQGERFPDANLWDLPIALPFAGFALGGALLTAIVTRMIVPDGAGNDPSLAGSAQAVLNDLPALAVIGLVSNIVVLAGILFFVVPGLILGVLQALLIPVRTIERPDLVRTCVRSAVLTKNNRWAILGMWIAVIVAQVVCEIAINVMTGNPALAGYTGYPRNAGTAGIIGSTLVATALSIVAATGTAVLYCELRRLKDGPAPTELASEFD